MKSFLRRLTATALAKAKGNRAFSGSNKSWLRKQVRDGRQDQHQEETTEPSCDGGPGTGAPSLVSLCHGADHRPDPPPVRRRAAGGGAALLDRRALTHQQDITGR